MNQSYSILNAVSLGATTATEYTLSGTKKYYYSQYGLDIPIPFESGYDTVLVALRNMSSSAKTAGTAGAVKVTLIVQK